MATYEELNIGDSCTYEREITDQMIRAFAEVSGDVNPIHLDEEYAATSMFKERIAHGALVSSFLSKLLGCDLPGPGSVYVSQYTKFMRPVKIGDTITAIIEVKEKDEKKGYVTFRTYCKNQRGKVVVDGEAVGIPPKS
ncbi:MAG: MaoC family dehydratase [Cyclobacteriaceae bacterium]